jgi:aconitate hydratase
MQAQGRGDAWVELSADEGAGYDEYDEIDLSLIEPLIAKPSSPGNVVAVREVAGLKVDQVIVGSSVNSSFRDLMVLQASLTEDAPRWISTCESGSRQVIEI